MVPCSQLINRSRSSYSGNRQTRTTTVTLVHVLRGLIIIMMTSFNLKDAQMLLSEQITLMSDQNHFCSDNVSLHILLLISSTEQGLLIHKLQNVYNKSPSIVVYMYPANIKSYA